MIALHWTGRGLSICQPAKNYIVHKSCWQIDLQFTRAVVGVVERGATVGAASVGVTKQSSLFTTGAGAD